MGAGAPGEGAEPQEEAPAEVMRSGVSWGNEIKLGETNMQAREGGGRKRSRPFTGLIYDSDTDKNSSSGIYAARRFINKLLNSE